METVKKATMDAEVIEFEIWQDDWMVAGGVTSNAKKALQEADHYAMMYGQDGPVEIKFFIRRSATREELELFADYHCVKRCAAEHPKE